MDFINCLKTSKNTFIIAEIGQNHQGNIEIAKKLIKIAKDCGADCVKFQKTDLKEKFNNKALLRPYNSPHSFGKTYGEHKQFLEFSKDDYRELKYFANKVGILVTASAMDVKSLEFLIDLEVPFIKIGSGDANNFILIEKAAKTAIPLVISTGMQNFVTVKQVYHLVSKYHKNFVFLHCVSAYPTPIEDINLNVINLFKSTFPDILIGYSGHELGTHISVAAVALGAKVIERHLTLNKNQKGSDHACSLDPVEFRSLVTNIRNVEAAMGRPIKEFQISEKPCYEKLGKTLVYTKRLKSGHKLENGDINVKVAEPKGIDGAEMAKIIGKKLLIDVLEDESILFNHLE
ncbi:sialic acid synthase [Diorhabda carinulata]|uniref:sialic acid synthase n=1 Tax=Diorhabda carinulata TaxID=1163345 RepID=UPI0025A06754|nr:sialic acid synthase [Diorhabda carinulata]